MNNLPYTWDSADTCPASSDPVASCGQASTGPVSGGFCSGDAQVAFLPLPGTGGGCYTGGQVIWPGNVATPPCTAAG